MSVQELADYSADAVPAGYECGECHATNCKLWRPYNQFPDEVTPLLCAVHAAKRENKSIEGIDAIGMRPGSDGLQTDQIGYYVPAVPHDRIPEAYHSYTAVSDDGVAWWERLPTLPT